MCHGRYGESVVLTEEVLQRQRETSGGEHPQTIHCMTCLANMKSLNEELAAAKDIFEAVLSIQKRIYGHGNAKTWTTMRLIGQVT